MQNSAVCYRVVDLLHQIDSGPRIKTLRRCLALGNSALESQFLPQENWL